MRTVKLIALALSIARMTHPILASAQQVPLDDVDPRELRRIWMHSPTTLSAAAYTLTGTDKVRFKGSFGVDLSHYSFDISGNKLCHTTGKYNSIACSCSVDWGALSKSGISFVYSKASDGTGQDISFPRVWRELRKEHDSGKILRGAFHFLRPGISADQQAAAFLDAVHEEGKYTSQIMPMLDVEWSNRQVILGTSEFKACPVRRRVKSPTGKYYCDMWYKLSPAEIIALAQKWIDIVSKATGQKVVVYTNTSAWWNPVIGKAGEAFVKTLAVWPSRYTSGGPVYNQNWTSMGGNPHWRMPPLPRGASFPQDAYTVPHLWQFTDNGFVPNKAFLCLGAPKSRGMDMDWIPVPEDKLQSLMNAK